MNRLIRITLCSSIIGATAFFITSCAAYKLDTAQTQLRTTFASGDYVATANLIKQLDQNQIYKSKDQVLFNLEAGLANHFAGNYQESSTHFTEAEYIMEDLYSKSISRAVKSFLINDNSLDYDGEDYEDIYLNIFKGLNYIHMSDLEGALVETRRVTHKLGQLDQKYNGLVEALSKADTTSTGGDKWKAGKTKFENSALARYLSTILYAKTGKQDDARIEYEKLVEAYQEQPSIYRLGNEELDELSVLKDPESYNFLVQAFSGRAPVKVQNDVSFYIEESDTYLKFSLPELRSFNSQVSTIEVTVDSSETTTLRMIEEMDLVAEEVYKVKKPIIYARAIVRSFLKMLAAKKLEKEAEDEDETLGMIVGFLGKVAQDATEKADLRSWQTMPGKAYSTVLNLTPGEHVLDISYISNNGIVVHTENRVVNVGENESLGLVESIYWN